MRTTIDGPSQPTLSDAGAFGARMLEGSLGAPPAESRESTHRRRRAQDGIVGESEGLLHVLDRIERVGPTNASVLITGETGTGKELVARAIHNRSRRSTRAFLGVNLAVVPQELTASEVFGHEAGAFTGAVQRRIGRFEAADGGTLFLDEVGDLPSGVQVALLRALQEGEFERVGSSQTRKADVRVVAATNRNLEEWIQRGSFRSDLFYRLAVFPIHLPALRERVDDIPRLAEHFLAKLGDRLGRRFSRIGRDSMARMMGYDWPGNIRELQNVLEHSAILSDGGDLWVPPILLSSKVIAGPTNISRLSEAVDDAERQMIEQALESCGGRVFGPSGAAERLGLPSSTLESKIKRLGINKLLYRVVARS